MDQWITAALAGLEAIGAWRYLVAFVGMFCETSLLIGLVVLGYIVGFPFMWIALQEAKSTSRRIWAAVGRRPGHL